MTDITAIEELTPREFRLLSIGAQLRDLDKQEELHLAAWLGQVVQSTEGTQNNRRYKYTTFEMFFPKAKYEKKIRNQKTDSGREGEARSRLARRAAYEKLKKGGENNG